MCPAAYREALTRHLSSTASSASTSASTSAPNQRQAAEAGREGVVGRPLPHRRNPGPDDLESRVATTIGAVAEGRLSMALGEDATVINGETTVQR
jgi:hypothetical protein